MTDELRVDDPTTYLTLSAEPEQVYEGEGSPATDEPDTEAEQRALWGDR